MYLTPADYSIQVRSEIKALLKGEGNLKLDKAETASVKRIKSYLSQRYDVDKIFFIINPWKLDVAVKEGKYVWFSFGSTDDDISVYKCIADAPAGTMPTDETYFIEEDPRDPDINTLVVDLTLYLLHSKDSQRMIPESRQNRYDDAIEWLKAVGAGELQADLPQKQDEDDTYQPYVRFGSYPRENHRY